MLSVLGGKSSLKELRGIVGKALFPCRQVLIGGHCIGIKGLNKWQLQIVAHNIVSGNTTTRERLDEAEFERLRDLLARDLFA